jgi:hypothetical protein
MRFIVSLRADDLLLLERGTPEPMESGEYQFAVKCGEPYLYATADELDQIADHFNALATNLRKETQ